MIEHRQKSHSELVLLLTALVSKLPISDVGVIVSKLVEHNSGVAEVCAALAHGKADAPLPQPMVLKALEQTKSELLAGIKATVEELIALNTPLDSEMLKGFASQPASFFSASAIRATRGYFKGQVPRERVVKEFGDAAIALFNDVTTGKLNPNPKPEEISLAFKSDFEALLPQAVTSRRTSRRNCGREYPESAKEQGGHSRSARAEERVPEVIIPARTAALLREPEHGGAGRDFCPTAPGIGRAIGRHWPAGSSR